MSEDIMEIDRAKEPYTYFSISTVQTLAQTIARLQEQLNEANEVIKNMKSCMDDKYDYDCVAEDVDIYLEKWKV